MSISQAEQKKAELNIADALAFQLDTIISTLREQQAVLNSKRSKLQVEYQRLEALEAQAAQGAAAEASNSGGG